VNRAFNWAHTFHRSLYDLFAADKIRDKEAIYRKLLANYLDKPEAITSHRLDHHGKLWSFPESTGFRDKSAIFDNLHMLHDNIDDVLSRPDLYPTIETKRTAILKILPIYLHRNHAPEDRFANFHGMAPGGAHDAHGTMAHGMRGMMDMGPRPPSAADVLEGRVSREKPKAKPAEGGQEHRH
jgi:hypothetical protein